MSNRLDVLKGVRAMIVAALPGADVVGVDNNAEVPDRICPFGRVIIRPGDPGKPDIDLNPVSYNYQHRIPIELVAYSSDLLTPAEAIDDMLQAIGAAIEADRFLGGLVDYLDANSPLTDDLYEEGAPDAHEAAADIVATYSTTTPL